MHARAEGRRLMTPQNREEFRPPPCALEYTPAVIKTMTQTDLPIGTREITPDGPRDDSDDGWVSHPASKVRPRAGTGYLWLRVLLTVGLLLGLLLLVQSVTTYYQVSRNIVTAELQSEAHHYLTSIERETRRMNIRGAAGLRQLLDEIREESQNRIAWARVTDRTGQAVVNSGNAVGQPFGEEKLRRAFEQMTPASQIRHTAAGEVLVTALPLRMGARRIEQGGERAGIRESDFVRNARSLEIALYVDGAPGAFGRLRTNLAISASAALGLVASMILLLVRLPHYVRGKQLQRQTELARHVQMDLLPAADAVLEGIDFAGVCIPAQQVGGDFYDAFTNGDGRTAIVVGDVSGKGLPASMVVGLLLGAVRASGWMRGKSEHETSSRRLSELLRTRTAPERFASMFWCYYEPEPRSLRYVNAGHLPPLLVSRLEGGGLSVRHLTEGGPVLGLLRTAEYRQGTATASAGDLLVLFSDGVVEARSDSGELFDEARLLAVIREHAAGTPAEIRGALLKAVFSFLGKAQAEDDLTLVVARFG